MPEANLKITLDNAQVEAGLTKEAGLWKKNTEAITQAKNAARAFNAEQKAVRGEALMMMRAQSQNAAVGRGGPGLIAGAMNMRTLIAGAGAYGMASFAMSAMDSAQKAGKTERAFNSLLQTAGKTANARSVLEQLAEATNYTAEKSELAAGANRMLAVNSKLTIPQLVTATAWAKRWAGATGGEVVPTMEAVAMALSNVAPRMLKNIGLEIDEAAAYDATAAALHKKVGALTELEKMESRRAAALAAMERRVREMPSGGPEDSTAQVKVAAKEAKDAIGKLLTPNSQQGSAVTAKDFVGVLSGNRAGKPPGGRWDNWVELVQKSNWEVRNDIIEILGGERDVKPWDYAGDASGQSSLGPASRGLVAARKGRPVPVHNMGLPDSGNFDRLIFHPRAFHINEVGG